MNVAIKTKTAFKPSIIGSDFLRGIPIKENGEELVDTKDYCPNLRFDIASYIINPTEIASARFVRRTVAEMINTAIKNLPDGYGFIFRCGYRSLKMQKKSYENLETKLANEHPNWDRTTLDRRLDECVAPVDIAPHCTGGAIDIFLCDYCGNYVDVECEPGELSDRTYTCSSAISQKARDNRSILIDALTESGLNNFPGEIWHWSYGEYDWAAYQNQPMVVYGPIENKRRSTLPYIPNY